jgi:hypothetical protein
LGRQSHPSQSHPSQHGICCPPRWKRRETNGVWAPHCRVHWRVNGILLHATKWDARCAGVCRSGTWYCNADCFLNKRTAFQRIALGVTSKTDVRSTKNSTHCPLLDPCHSASCDCADLYVLLYATSSTYLKVRKALSWVWNRNNYNRCSAAIGAVLQQERLGTRARKTSIGAVLQ